ncbi:hypothetical protein V1478_015496 [Vespula squamosa]|uniref:Uncharacterized protein n=1 Tax=Vespula squamosa TaxID=30214 RepID=A0ABD2A598_VESSQ
MYFNVLKVFDVNVRSGGNSVHPMSKRGRSIRLRRRSHFGHDCSCAMRSTAIYIFGFKIFKSSKVEQSFRYSAAF